MNTLLYTFVQFVLYQQLRLDYSRMFLSLCTVLFAFSKTPPSPISCFIFSTANEAVIEAVPDLNLVCNIFFWVGNVGFGLFLLLLVQNYLHGMSKDVNILQGILLTSVCFEWGPWENDAGSFLLV